MRWSRPDGRLHNGEMSTYVLIHGAGGSDSWYWHLVAPQLRARGHDVVAPDLPSDDPSAGLQEFADVVVDAIGDRKDLVVVAQSFAGFTSPLVCDRVPVDLLVLVAAMIPRPGESAAQWWVNTGWQQPAGGADGQFDLVGTFFHDVPPPVYAAAMARGTREEADTAFGQPWPSPNPAHRDLRRAVLPTLPFSVFYRPTKRAIEVVRVLHHAQDIPPLLDEM